MHAIRQLPQTLVTYDLDIDGTVSDANGGNIDVAQIGHIHENSVSEGGGVVADPFSEYLGSIDPTDPAARNSRIIEAEYDELVSYGCICEHDPINPAPLVIKTPMYLVGYVVWGVRELRRRRGASGGVRRQHEWRQRLRSVSISSKPFGGREVVVVEWAAITKTRVVGAPLRVPCLLEGETGQGTTHGNFSFLLVLAAVSLVITAGPEVNKAPIPTGESARELALELRHVGRRSAELPLQDRSYVDGNWIKLADVREGRIGVGMFDYVRRVAAPDNRWTTVERRHAADGIGELNMVNMPADGLRGDKKIRVVLPEQGTQVITEGFEHGVIVSNRPEEGICRRVSAVRRLREGTMHDVGCADPFSKRVVFIPAQCHVVYLCPYAFVQLALKSEARRVRHCCGKQRRVHDLPLCVGEPCHQPAARERGIVQVRG